MGMSLQGQGADLDDGTTIYGTWASRAWSSVRPLCTPSTLALVGVLAFSWLALIGWTGAGPDSWQARSCAGLDLPPASCSAAQAPKNQDRLVPHMDLGASS